MRVPPLVCLCLFPGVFLCSRVTGACPVTTDFIMRVNVRTTTTCIGVNVACYIHVIVFSFFFMYIHDTYMS